MGLRQVVLLGSLLLVFGCGGEGSETRTVTLHLVWDASTTIQSVVVETTSDTHGYQSHEIARPASGSRDLTMTASTDAKIRLFGTGVSNGYAWDGTGVISRLPLESRTIRFGGPVNDIHLTGYYFELGSGRPDSFSYPVEVGEFWNSSLRAWGTGSGGELVLFAASDVIFTSSNSAVASVEGFGNPVVNGPGQATFTVQDGASGPSDGWSVTVVPPGPASR